MQETAIKGKSQMKTQQRRRIAFASVLKPIDDTRMFEKMAVSLADTERYEVYIIGYPSAQLPSHSNIHFLPLFSFKRLSFARLLAPIKVLQLVLQVKPELLMVTTHDLLIVAFLNKILFGTKIVYDIQENYYRNLKFTNAFPPIIRSIIATGVRLKEIFFAPFFHWFLLAEKGYEKEMNFFRDRYTIIENKAIIPASFSRKKKIDNTIVLLFSGTLAESTGVFEAIHLAKLLHEKDDRIRLRIVGYCARQSVLTKISNLIKESFFIQLTGGDQLVPHSQITKAISESDFGIIYYPPSAHTQNSVPTKLYEYLAYKLPVLIQNHEPWRNKVAEYHAGFVVDFIHPDTAAILDQMKSAFYTTPPLGVSWQEEVPKLLESFDHL